MGFLDRLIGKTVPYAYVREAQVVLTRSADYPDRYDGAAIDLREETLELAAAIAVAAKAHRLAAHDEQPAPLLSGAPQTAALILLASSFLLHGGASQDEVPTPAEMEALMAGPRVGPWYDAVRQATKQPPKAADDDTEIAAYMAARPDPDEQAAMLDDVEELLAELASTRAAIEELPYTEMTGPAAEPAQRAARFVLATLRRGAPAAWGPIAARGIVQLCAEMLELILDTQEADVDELDTDSVHPEETPLDLGGWGDAMVAPGAAVTGHGAEVSMSLLEVVSDLIVGIAVVTEVAEEDVGLALDDELLATLAVSLHGVDERTLAAPADPERVITQPLLIAADLVSTLLGAAVLARAGEEPGIDGSGFTWRLDRDDLREWADRLDAGPESLLVNRRAGVRLAEPFADPAAALVSLRAACAALEQPYGELAGRFETRPRQEGESWTDADADAALALAAEPARALRDVLGPARTIVDLDGDALTCVTALRMALHSLVVMSGFDAAPAIGRRVVSAGFMATMVAATR